MLTHQERIDTARSAVEYICGRSDDELRQPVPNCPGWSVYHAASHIGRVAFAWKAMILATPDDPESRNRGYAEADRLPAGTDTATLAASAHDAIDQLVDDPDTAAYFSMTGGHGTRRMWASHAATELGIHRLDVESALGHDYSMTEVQAADALAYSFEFFLPGMANAADANPGSVTLIPLGIDSNELTSTTMETDGEGAVTLRGSGVDLLLALWGRAHESVEVVDGDPAVLDEWRSVPATAIQFGAWD